jgi:hypothetical protein
MKLRLGLPTLNHTKKIIVENVDALIVNLKLQYYG